MARSLLTLGALSAALGVLGVIAFACGDPPVEQPCTGVPDGGCPLAHGVACQDPHCAAIYACRENNVWELVQACPGYDAAIDDVPDAGADATTDIVDASIDAPPGAFGGPGCEPLMDSDCSLGLALACTNGCCGCVDLYVCNDGEWDEWGSCDPDAGLRPDKP